MPTRPVYWGIPVSGRLHGRASTAEAFLTVSTRQASLFASGRCLRKSAFQPPHGSLHKDQASGWTRDVGGTQSDPAAPFWLLSAKQLARLHEEPRKGKPRTCRVHGQPEGLCLTGALPAGRWKRDVIAPSVQLSKTSQNQALRDAGCRLRNLGTRTRRAADGRCLWGGRLMRFCTGFFSNR